MTGPARVLVVEDEGIVALDISRRLQSLGYVVPAVAASGEEAIRLAASEHPDVVVLDILLSGGGMDGIEAGGHIRADYGIPIIYLTAYTDRRTLERAKVTEPDAYIPKPFTEKALESAIEMAIYKHRMDRRFAFLARASAALNAERLDHFARLNTLANLVVPEIADFCVIDVMDGEDAVTRLAIAHADPEKQAWSREFPRKYRVPANDTHENWVQTPRTYTGSAPPPCLQADPLLQGIEGRAYLQTPLQVSGRVIGSLTLVTADPTRSFENDDVSLVEDLVHRAELSVEVAILYEKAQNAIRARDDVLAIVSHDLKNPLSVIHLTVATARMTALRADPANPIVEHLARIDRAARRMEHLIASLLDAAKIEAGRFDVETARQPLRAVLTEALESVQALAAQKQVQVEVALDGDVDVRCDRRRIVQVLVNILENAIRFSPSGEAVRVCIEKGNRTVRVRVADRGPGIPAEDRPHVFERYWQASEKKREGSGLGLFIAKGIIEAHGGTIGLDEEHPSGAAFVFELPVWDDGH